MTDPTRILEAEGDSFERALLASASTDRGSEAARRRALAVFGPMALSLATATSQGAVLSAGQAAAAGTAKVTLGALTKWIGVGVVAGSVSAGGLQALFEAPAPSLQQTASRSTAGPAPSLAAAAPTRRWKTAEEPVEPAPAVSSPRPTGGAERAAPPLPDGGKRDTAPSRAAFPAQGAPSRLGEEVQALERVRHALYRGDAQAGLDELRQYEARFPGGALAREATLLSVEARLRAGDVAGARTAAARVLASDKTSPHARKIQALLASKGLK